MNPRTTDPLRCSFCGKSQGEVARLINGPSVTICNECIDICNEIIADERAANERANKGERSPAPKAVYVGTVACPVCRAHFALHTDVTEGHS